MKTEIINCDICGYQFSGKENWDAVPCQVSLNLGVPRQVYESTTYQHVCYHCVNVVKDAFNSAVAMRRGPIL